MDNFGPYQHPYGGTAIDVYVSRARFARTFEFAPEALDYLPVGMKVGTKLESGKEVCGYVMKGPRCGRHFLLTIITYR